MVGIVADADPRTVLMGHELPYSRSPHASASAVGDRIVLYHHVSRAAIVLNPTGSLVWEALDTPQTLAQLTSRLQARYPTLDAVRAEQDVTAFLSELTTHAMVATADDRAGVR